MAEFTSKTEQEQGVALLTVLLLVAVMAVISAAVLERLTLSTRLSANSAAMDQARAYADSASLLVESRLTRLMDAAPGSVSLADGWMGRPHNVPVPGGNALVTVWDGGNCFNINSLVSGEDGNDLKQRPMAVTQFIALMQLLGIKPQNAYHVAYASADWLDSDGIPVPGGAEDETYGAATPSYRTANRLMVDPSELRAVSGVTPAIYNVLKPWVCALPTTDLSPINANTLLPEQAPLLAMMIPGKSALEKSRHVIVRRPRGGYDSTVTFWAGFGDLMPPAEAAEQIALTTRWFKTDIAVDIGNTHMRQWTLYDARVNPVQPVRTIWGDEG